jgi:hypothetical protein
MRRLEKTLGFPALAEPEALAESDSPLVLAARTASPRVAGALGGVALFATANTARIARVAGSRMRFGTARAGDPPSALARVLPGRRSLASFPRAAWIGGGAALGGALLLRLALVRGRRPVR